jgi:hypothetical protein
MTSLVADKWAIWQRDAVVMTDELLHEMIDEVVDAHQALSKVNTDEFVLAKRALAMHWNALTSCAHFRGLTYRGLDEGRATRTSRDAQEGGNG